MPAIRDHTVDDYSVLPDMDATDVGVLSDGDQACLDEIGRYLVESDAGQRFAIWLLHKHFDPAPGEVFVERTVATPRGTQTDLVERAALPGLALNTTAIRFDYEVSTGVDVIGMEFATPADFGSTAPLNDNDDAALSGIAERLRAYRKADRFGVRLIRNSLSLADREVLLETSNTAERTLHCEVSHRDAIPADQIVVGTVWQYAPACGGIGPSVMQNCVAGCVRVGDGHDLGHESTLQDDSGDF